MDVQNGRFAAKAIDAEIHQAFDILPHLVLPLAGRPSQL
jgi:hypothetical protein